MEIRTLLSQTQTIRALSEALEWFEKELGWGVQPAALGHLTGRIGELFVAVMSAGQMADKTHTPGYDVIGADSERISVKTVTTSSHVAFNRLCCTNRLGDSPRESSVVAAMHEQTHAPDLQDQELAILQ